MIASTKNLAYRIKFRILSDLLGILTPIEALLLGQGLDSEELKPNPIFIVGAPRTGSTFVYQAITSYFRVNYISNFRAYFYRCLYLGFLLSDWLFKDKSHNVFRSDHGLSKGLAAPHECGQFWFRWFPKNKDYVSSEEYQEGDLKGLRRTFVAISRSSKKPIVIKNLNNGQRLQVLYKVFPGALIIYCKRNPLYTAQSILNSRLTFFNNKRRWFSVKPPNYDEIKKLDYAPQIVKQVYYIQKQIEKDLNLFKPEQSLVVNYEEFCSDSKQELQKVQTFLSRNNIVVEQRPNSSIPNARLDDNRIKTKHKDFSLLKQEIEKLSW